MNAVVNASERLMSSKEIAQLTASRHDSVKRTIERLAEPGVITFTPMVEKSSGGRPGTEYLINQRDSYVVVAQIDAKFTAKLVDRWMELEGIAKPKQLPIEKTPSLFKGFYGIGKLLGLDKNAAAISANQAVFAASGQNVLALMGQTHLESESQQHWHTPSTLGEMLEISGRSLNSILADHGFQEKVGDQWTPTAKGLPYARIFDTGKRQGNGTPITQLKWSVEILNAIGSVR